MVRRLILAAVVFALFTPPIFARDVVDPRPRPLVQIAILLATSNSMDGLIRQAKTQLWTIVNETARCKLDGRQPRLQVALYEYGNSRLPITEGYIRQVLPFTDDLDRESLRQALQRSLDYARRLQPDRMLPFGERQITSTTLIQTLEAFQQVLAMAPTPVAMQQALRERFDVLQSPGRDAHNARPSAARPRGW